jgi:predicted CxxxxCH...CXXCH cytochrome family protein
MRNLQLASLALAGATLLACGKERRPAIGQPPDGQVSVDDPDGGPATVVDLASCTRCHGDVTRSSTDADPIVAVAPPRSVKGEVAASARGVGAHQAHLVLGPLSRAVKCTSCHRIPSETGDHAATAERVRFRGTAILGGAAPVYDAAVGSCASTYCHGNFKNGNAGNVVAWTGTAGCGSCHDLPPGGTHPNNAACGACHPGYSAGFPDPATHVDGQADVSLSCSTCHGDASRVPVASATALDPLGANLVKASPPLDAQGGTGAAVGAHLAHVNQGAAAPALSNAITCATCHPVPASSVHANSSVEVTFTGVAAASGASFAAGTLTCSSTYCHGNFAGGNGANPVAWTAAGKLGCTACHGSPPGPVSATVHHPQNTSCGACHAGYTAAAVVAATHVDGAVQKPADGCTQCHGDITASGVASTDVRAAPASNASAVDTQGNGAGATSQRGVGAHQAHLLGTTWRSEAIACGECHVVPATGDTAHASSATATVTFGALASKAWSGQPPIAPAWNGAGGASTLTCSSTYCHGAFKNGASATPTWATPSAVTCGSCHATPPGGTHPAVPTVNCGNCHSGYDYDPSTGLGAGVDRSRHISGLLDF